MILTEYNPHWSIAYQELEEVYRDVLGNLITSVEHIGSTAIVGIAAKPIIDIDIVFDEYSLFPEIKNRLESLGYWHNGDQGIPQREVFKREDENVPPYGDRKSWINHHLYACPKDSRALHRHILFRDYLNRNEEEKMKYEKIKRAIEARSNGSRKTYAKIKEEEEDCSNFIETILQKPKQGFEKGR